MAAASHSKDQGGGHGGLLRFAPDGNPPQSRVPKSARHLKVEQLWILRSVDQCSLSPALVELAEAAPLPPSIAIKERNHPRPQQRRELLARFRLNRPARCARWLASALKQRVDDPLCRSRQHFRVRPCLRLRWYFDPRTVAEGRSETECMPLHLRFQPSDLSRKWKPGRTKASAPTGKRPQAGPQSPHIQADSKRTCCP